MTLAPLRPLGPPDTAVGLTVGAEEEFHLVDPDTGATASCPELLDIAGAGRCGAHVQAELQSCQLETATDVCVTLADLRGQLAMARGEAAAAAASAGAALLGSAMHPFSSWREVELTDRPRYRRLESRFGFLTNQQVICGCHVHVSVPDLDTAVAVMAHARPWLPLLIALTGSSPFQDGRDTGFDSWRIESWQRWPHAGPPPRLSCAAEYQEAVAELVAAGIIDDASNLYWDVRPSLRYPTVEFRVADACPNLEDTLMYAALVRSLARTVAVQAERGMPAPEMRDETLRAARWRAARYGLRDRLVDPVLGTLVTAPVAVRRLLRALEPDLAQRGEWDFVATRVSVLLRRGTSASRQRAVYAATGDLAAVVRDTVAQTETSARAVSDSSCAG